MNTVNLIGRLTRDIELRYTQSGKAVANGSIAVNRAFKNQEGNYDADFINLVMFGKTAEIMANYVKKGHQVGIEGRIQSGSYEKDGKRVYTTDVVVNQFTFIDNRNSSGKSNSSQSQTQTTVEQNHTEGIVITDDDLPF